MESDGALDATPDDNLADTLKALETMVAAHDTAAPPALRAAMPRLEAAGLGAQAARVARALEDYDFEQAAALLEKLVALRSRG